MERRESILGASLAGHNRRTLILTSSFSINMAEDKESINNEEPEPVHVLYTTAQDSKKVYVDKVHDEVLKVAQKWNVSLDMGQDCGVYHFQGKQSTWYGNRPIEGNTKANNENMFCQVWRLCALKGDYESMLILVCTEPTRNVPPIEARDGRRVFVV
jgi:hypothetical protein